MLTGHAERVLGYLSGEEIGLGGLNISAIVRGTRLPRDAVGEALNELVKDRYIRVAKRVGESPYPVIVLRVIRAA